MVFCSNHVYSNHVFTSPVIVGSLLPDFARYILGLAQGVVSKGVVSIGYCKSCLCY